MFRCCRHVRRPEVVWLPGLWGPVADPSPGVFLLLFASDEQLREVVENRKERVVGVAPTSKQTNCFTNSKVKLSAGVVPVCVTASLASGSVL